MVDITRYGVMVLAETLHPLNHCPHFNLLTCCAEMLFHVLCRTRPSVVRVYLLQYIHCIEYCMFAMESECPSCHLIFWPLAAFLINSFLASTRVIDVFKMASSSSISELLALAMRRSPFVTFAKRAPSTLPVYNIESDFTYFFFSDAMKRESGFSPHVLASGSRNAKTDFPVDFEDYFRDDAAVCLEYPFPSVKMITERWLTAATHTILETRKTAALIDNELFMLGSFGPHDEIDLGLTSFKANHVPPLLDPLRHVTDAWYEQAFAQLPLASKIYHIASETYEIQDTVDENSLSKDSFLTDSSLEKCLEWVKSAGIEYSAFHVSHAEIVMISGNNHKSQKTPIREPGISHRARVWLWRPDPANPCILAVACRPTREVTPHLIREATKWCYEKQEGSQA